MRDLDRRFASPPHSMRGIAIPILNGLKVGTLWHYLLCYNTSIEESVKSDMGGESMANEQNLKPILDTERAQELGRLGGIASGVARRKKRTMKEAAQQILSGSLVFGDDSTKEILALLGIDVPTNADGIMLVATLKASRGDIEAARFVRDTGGEVPTSKVEVGGIEDKPIEVLDLSALTDAQLQELAAKRLGDG